MRALPIALAPIVFAVAIPAAFGQARTIDLRTTDGVKSVQGTWKFTT
ncbi:MAG: hypothetical protein U0800_27065 [Isosphaeraceae bacterium]